MAVVSPAPAMTPLNSLGFLEFRGSGGTVVRNGGEIVEESAAAGVARGVVEEKIYVALGKPVKEFKSVLMWALQNSGGKKVCIIHVHQPAQMIPLMGTKFPVSALKEQQVLLYREIEKEDMQKILDEYLSICRRMGVRAEKLTIENDCIEDGILELIADHGICKLVMGAAADKRYSKSMIDIKSKKAISVRQQAPASCHIWFICKGNLIHTREGSPEVNRIQVRSPSQQTSGNSETGQSNHLRSQSIAIGERSPSQQISPCTDTGLLNHIRSESVAKGENKYVKPTNPAQDLMVKVKHMSFGRHAERIRTPPASPDEIERVSTPWSMSDPDGSADECDVLSRRSTSQGSVLSSCPSSGMASLVSVPIETIEVREFGSELSTLQQFKENFHLSSPPSVLDGSIEDPLYDQLEQAMAEALNSKREALEETVRRAKAEKDAYEAIRRAKALESLHAEESKLRKELDEALAKEKDQLAKIMDERDGVMERLRIAHDQRSLLESQIAESDQMVEELEQKILSAVDLLQNYKEERDKLQVERDNALNEAEELRRCRAETSSTHLPQFFSEFSFAEIEEATHNFDPSLKIGEGGYGSIYKGVLRYTQVAIKMLHSHSLQGPSEFQQEVDVLSKMRHPNLVTLVGACPEAWTLVYEYLPNGSLEDRLSCRDNSPPLSWQMRIRIAAELCSVLIFLHSSKPHSIVHGDLKPANILLDANFVSKLSDFGISRLLCHSEGSSNNTTVCRTDPKGTFLYMDPEFLAAGELTPKSDVYSFGIILLRLLTGRPALGITKEVQYALDKGKLQMLLDPLAGDWPFVQAEQLARLALRCCEMNRKSRPDLASEVLRILESMKASCGGSSCFHIGSEEHRQPPPYFICPIFQEVMRDPHVAADGFTYEAEALRGWLDSGHNTSPMTNLTLAHTNLVPNHALRSAIQEWLQPQ